MSTAATTRKAIGQPSPSMSPPKTGQAAAMPRTAAKVTKPLAQEIWCSGHPMRWRGRRRDGSGAVNQPMMPR